MEQLLSHIIFDWPHCYEVTLVKKYEPLLQKKRNKGFRPKKIDQKACSKSTRKKLGSFEVKSDIVYIAKNKQMFAVQLQANLAVVCNL